MSCTCRVLLYGQRECRFTDELVELFRKIDPEFETDSVSIRPGKEGELVTVFTFKAAGAAWEFKKKADKAVAAGEINEVILVDPREGRGISHIPKYSCLRVLGASRGKDGKYTPFNDPGSEEGWAAIVVEGAKMAGIEDPPVKVFGANTFPGYKNSAKHHCAGESIERNCAFQMSILSVCVYFI